MDLIDTHCHVQSLAADLGEPHTRQLWKKAEGLTADKVLENAKLHGVTEMICVGCELEDSINAVDFVQDKPQCFAAIGIHPHEAKSYASDFEALEHFSALVDRPKVVAIGECGLDYFYNHSDKKDQIEVLKFQIELAIEYNLPMIFHVREAFDDFWPIFELYDGIRGVLHSFTDNQANLERALGHGLHIGVNGIVTFSKDPTQLEVYKAIPLTSLVLETDSPFLTPTPYRGTINEPMRVGVVADFLANLRQESRLDLAKSTTINAKKLFGI
jgi:TatD DNase family protein